MWSGIPAFYGPPAGLSGDRGRCRVSWYDLCCDLTPMTDSLPSHLLARFLAGETSAADRAEVEAWAAADPANRAELDRLRTLWLPPAEGPWDVNRAWARLVPRLEQAPAPAVIQLRPGRRLALALAASLVLALGATLLWRAFGPARVPAPRVVATQAGEQRAFDLPDGSHLVLAPASVLRVSPQYGRPERRVDLEGEAWFEVRHDASRPFRVYARGTVTEDLGTEFSVRAIAGESSVRVTVVSGSASLRRAGAPAAAAATLLARTVGVLPAGAVSPRVEREADVEALVAWREGRMIFENAPLDSVAAEISRWYGVTVRLAGPDLGARRLTATFRTGRLGDALEVLSLSLGVRVARHGDTVVVR